MNSKDIRGLTVISIVDGTQVGTVDQVYLDFAAKQVVGFSITNGVGPFGGSRNNAPTVAVSGIHSLGPDALTLDDVTAAHAAWVDGTFGALITLDDLAGRKVVTEGGANVGEVASVEFDERSFSITEVEVSPGFLKPNTQVSFDQLIRIGPDVLVIEELDATASAPASVAG